MFEVGRREFLKPCQDNDLKKSDLHAQSGGSVIRKRSASQTEYRPDIDGLRAIAVLAVVLGHAELIPGRGGWVGVDIFFVISGYLISGIILRGLYRGNFSLLDFYARRIRRIFPALAIVLLSTWILSSRLYPADAFHRLGRDVLTSAAYIQNFFVYIEVTHEPTFPHDTQFTLTHLWSLSVEEQFYLLWPLLLLIGHKSRQNLLVGVLLVAISSFLLNAVTVSKDLSAAYLLTWNRMWEIALGGNLACAETFFDHKPGLLRGLVSPTLLQRSRHIFGFVGIVLVITSIFGLALERFFSPRWQLIPTVGACMLILVGPNSWVNRHVLSSRPLVFVGLISYPLYLWHQPLIYLTGTMNFGSLRRSTVLVLVVLVSSALSYLTYEYVEKPIRSSASSKVAMALVLAVVFCAGLGYLTFTY